MCGINNEIIGVWEGFLELLMWKFQGLPPGDFDLILWIVPLPAEERIVASSDYDSTYDSTYETNHSDSSDFAQNEEEGEGGKKSAEGRDYLAGGIVLHPLLPSPEVGREVTEKTKSKWCSFSSSLFSKSPFHLILPAAGRISPLRPWNQWRCRTWSLSWINSTVGTSPFLA